MLEYDIIVENLRSNDIKSAKLDVTLVLAYIYRLCCEKPNLRDDERIEIKSYFLLSKARYCCEYLNKVDIKTIVSNIKSKLYENEPPKSSIKIFDNSDVNLSPGEHNDILNICKSDECLSYYEGYKINGTNIDKFSNKIEMIFSVLINLWRLIGKEENISTIIENYPGKLLFNNDTHKTEISIILCYYYKYFDDCISFNDMCRLLLHIDRSNQHYSIQFLLNHCYVIEDFINDIFTNYQHYTDITQPIGELLLLLCQYFPKFINIIKIYLIQNISHHDYLFFGIELFVRLARNNDSYIAIVIQILRTIIVNQIESDRSFIQRLKDNPRLVENIFRIIICNFENNLNCDMDCFNLLYVLRMCFVYCENDDLHEKLWQQVFCRYPKENHLLAIDSTYEANNVILDYLFYSISLSIIYNYTLRDDIEFESRIEKWLDHIGNFLVKCYHLKSNKCTGSILNPNFNHISQLMYFLYIYVDSQNYDYVIDYIKNDIFGDCYLPDVIFNNKHPSAVIMYDSKVNLTLFLDYLTLIHRHTGKNQLNEIITKIDNSVTPNLCKKPISNSNTHVTTLPLHYIQRLIKFPDYFKSNIVAIKEWIIRQIFECIYPLHDEMCELLNEFVKAFCSTFDQLKYKNRNECDMLKIDTLIIQSLFNDCKIDSQPNGCVLKIIGTQCNYIVKNIQLAQYLVCFYMLLCEKYGVFTNHNVNMVILDDDNLLQQWQMIPLKKILISTSNNWPHLGNNFISTFNAMIVDLRPQFFSDLIPHYNFLTKNKLSSLNVVKFTVKNDILLEYYTNMVKSYSNLLENNKICQYFIDFLTNYSHFKDTLINDTQNIDITKQVIQIFKYCMMIYPEKFVLDVLKVLFPNLEYQSIIKSPSNLFQNSLHIFTDVLLVEIYIYCLDYIMVISEQFIYLQMHRIYQHDRQINDNINNPSQPDSNNDHMNNMYYTLCLANKSSIVQLLIESLDYTYYNRSQFEWLQMEHLFSKVGMYIHLLFVKNSDLIKLVHLQTYPISSIGWVTKHVPSIHICQEFLPELIVTESYVRLEFSFKLYCDLIGKYMLPRLLNFMPIFFKVFVTIFEHFVDTKDPSLIDITRLLSHLECLIYINNFTVIQVVTLLRECLILLDKVHIKMQSNYPYDKLKEIVMKITNRTIQLCGQNEISV